MLPPYHFWIHLTTAVDPPITFADPLSFSRILTPLPLPVTPYHFRWPPSIFPNFDTYPFPFHLKTWRGKQFPFYHVLQNFDPYPFSDTPNTFLPFYHFHVDPLTIFPIFWTPTTFDDPLSLSMTPYHFLKLWPPTTFVDSLPLPMTPSTIFPNCDPLPLSITHPTTSKSPLRLSHNFDLLPFLSKF